MYVELQYNPYWIQTKLIIEGTDVTQDADGRYARFQRYTDGIPLQTWLDPIQEDDWLGFPAELEKLGHGGISTVNIQFTGRQADFDDLRDAARRQRKQAQFQFPTPQTGLKDEDMDGLLQKSMEEIRSPRFATLLNRLKAGDSLREKYDGLEAEYARVRNTEFRIVFAGLYSSGKSTLLNALARRKLLPMADGTCTAKVFRIEHKLGIDVAEMCCTADGGTREVVPRRTFHSEAELQEEFRRIFPKGEPGKPSADPMGVDEVHLWTDLSHLYPEGFQDKFKLVLVDTPGTNSGIGNGAGGSISHHAVAAQAITSRDKEMVVLVAAAGNEQDESVTGLLREIDHALEGEHGAYDQRFLFVLNKCDCTSYANQESIESKIGVYREYISDSRPALKAPRVFPISALAALAVHSGVVDENQVTDQETQNLYGSYENLKKQCARKFGKENYCLERHAATPGAITQKLAQELEQAESSGDTPRMVLIHSGVPSLERSIQAYIARYAYPLKVQALLRTFYSIFTETAEWNSALVKEFEQVEKLRGEANQGKKEKEREKEVEDGRKKQLEDTNRILAACREEIGAIRFDPESIEGLRREADKKVFTKLWDRLSQYRGNKQITFGSRWEAEELVQHLKNTLEKGLQDANEKLDQVSKDISKQLRDILYKGNDALAKLRSSGALNLEGFDFTKSVAYEKIKTGFQPKVIAQDSMMTNPIKQEVFKPWQIFKMIEQFFAPEKIPGKEYTVDVAPIKDTLNSLRREFDQSCDALSRDCEELIRGTQREAAARINEVQDCLAKVAKSLDETKEQIRQLAENQARFKQEQEYLEAEKLFLEGIRGTLENCVPLM